MMHMNGIEPRLLQAVQAGRMKELKKLLATGTDVNVRSSWRGLAALHVAAINGYGGIAEMLLKHGADKDALDDTGETPLMKAAVEGHQPVVELLLKAGADIDIAGKSESSRAASCFYGSGALQYAVAAGHDGIVRTLLKYGADVNAQDDRGYTPLHCAIQVGRVGMAGTLLEAGAKTLVTDKEEQTPLVWAARQDDAVLVELIMEDRTELGERSTDGCFALLLAITNGRDGVVSALLQGANKHALDCDGERPLIWAVVADQVPMVNALVAAGVNVNARRGSDGCTALHMAAVDGHDELVSTLLRKGAYKDVLDNTGTTPLLLATAAGHLSAVETLLAEGANINLRSREDGFSALHLAAWQGHRGIVSALLRSGADTDVVDRNGDTALMLAAGNGHVSVVEVLLAAGADVSVHNSVEGEGYSALDWATKGEHVDVQDAICGLLAGSSASDEGGSTDLRLGPFTDHVDPIQAEIDAEFNFEDSASASDEGEDTDMPLGFCAEQVQLAELITEEAARLKDPTTAGDEGGGADMPLDLRNDLVDATQTLIEEESSFGDPVSASDESGGTYLHLGPRTDQVDITQAEIKKELDLGHQMETETAASASLTEGGDRSFLGLLSVPGWLDLEDICLAAALLFWFSARCKLRI